jgi:hypothetical protein
MNQLARINHLDLDDTRFSAAQTLDGVYAEPSIVGELRVYDLRQLFPRGFERGIQDPTSVGLRLSCDGGRAAWVPILDGCDV